LFMNNIRKSLFALILFLIFVWAGCQQQPASNNKGEKIRRIISLSPHITEILYALNQQDKIVGVTDFCRFPPEARRKESIGGFLNPNLEKIVMLEPDVLIGVPSHADLAAKLASRNLKMVLLPNDQLKDVFFAIDSLGRLLDCRAQAQALVKTIKDSLNLYRKKAAGILSYKPSAVMVIGRDAGSTGHITVVGPRTFLDSVWTMMGGKNAFSDLPAPYAQINRESFLLKQPEIIIEFKYNEPWDAQKDARNKKEWKNLFRVPAVKNGDIYVLTGNYTLIPGPRVYKLAEDFYRILLEYSKRSDK